MYLPAHVAGGFTLSDLLDEPGSRVPPLALPPWHSPLAFVFITKSTGIPRLFDFHLVLPIRAFSDRMEGKNKALRDVNIHEHLLDVLLLYAFVRCFGNVFGGGSNLANNRGARGHPTGLNRAAEPYR